MARAPPLPARADVVAAATPSGSFVVVFSLAALLLDESVGGVAPHCVAGSWIAFSPVSKWQLGWTTTTSGHRRT